MDDLVQFLRERLDEDERTARRVQPNQSPAELRAMTTREGSEPFLIIGSERVLAEIEAKRRIIADHEDAERTFSVAGPGTPPHDIMTGATNTLRRILRLHASVYDKHPAYKPEWRP